MSMVSLALVDVYKFADGSIGDRIALPWVMSNRHAIVSMKEGWEICIVPSSWSLEILMPSNQSGSPKSFISKLPSMSLTIWFIDSADMAAKSPLSMYHPAISAKLLFPNRKYTVVSMLLGLKPNLSISHFNVSCQTLPDCFKPYNPFFNLQTRCSFPFSMNPLGCLM